MKTTIALMVSGLLLLVAAGAFIYTNLNPSVATPIQQPLIQAQVVPPRDNPTDDKLPSDFKPATYSEAFTAAQRHQKRLFLIFSASWCPPCQAMKRDVWTDQRVKDRLAEYIVYVVDVDKESDVAAQYSVRSMPTYGVYEVVDGKPKVIKQASGGRSAKSMVDWLP